MLRQPSSMQPEMASPGNPIRERVSYPLAFHECLTSSVAREILHEIQDTASKLHESTEIFGGVKVANIEPQIFVTAQIAKLLRVPEWRIIKFVGGKEYGITPALAQAAGTGTRRLYDLENVCELALAWWLFQSGLRSDVVGWILRQIRTEQEPLKKLLELDKDQGNTLHLVITRTERKGHFLAPRQRVDFLRSIDDITRLLDTSEDNSSFVLIPVGANYLDLKRRLKKL